jgi:hypothetical protein
MLYPPFAPLFNDFVKEDDKKPCMFGMHVNQYREEDWLQSLIWGEEFREK